MTLHKGQRVMTSPDFTNVKNDVGTVVGVAYKPVSFTADGVPTKWVWVAHVNYDDGNDTDSIFDGMRFDHLIAL